MPAPRRRLRRRRLFGSVPKQLDFSQLTSSAYRALFDSSSDALLVHDARGAIVLVNAQVEAMFGWAPEDVGRFTISDLSENSPPHTEREAIGHLKRALDEGYARVEWRSRRRSGEIFWSELTLRAVEISGQPHVIASVRDIDARKRAEHALQESEERLAKIFNAASTMMSFTEPPHGIVVDANAAWLTALGLRREDVVGRTARSLDLWPNLSQRDAILRALETRGRVRDAECQLRVRGRILPTVLNAEYIEMRGVRYILWEVRDLTERKRAEREQEALREQLLQAQKMEAVGQLAGGVAHDFNNILSVILGFTDLALREIPPEDEARAHLAQVLQAGERASVLTRQLLTFSRKQVVQPKLLSPAAVLLEIEPMLRHLIDENSELMIVPHSASESILADRSQLELAVMNLVVNARDAMPGGGTITIEISACNLDAAEVAATPEARLGRHVVIAVSDTGTGMSAEVRARVFEPFFTTKDVGKGTGLGLSTVHGVVKQCGGWIALDSELGRGTTFRLYFPRAVASADFASAPFVPARAPEGTTVLVVEDDDQNRRFVCTVLSEAGYKVLEASSPPEALALAEYYEDEIHLLLTDVLMPHMNGKELADRFATTRPRTPVLYMSGYSKDTMLARGILESSVHFLIKPMTPGDLLAAASRMLQEEPKP